MSKVSARHGDVALCFEYVWQFIQSLYSDGSAKACAHRVDSDL